MDKLGFDPADVEDEDDFGFYNSAEDEKTDADSEGSKTYMELSFEDDSDDGADITISVDSSNKVEGDILTQEEKMRLYADKVISALVGGKTISDYAIGRLISSTNPRLFRDENYVLFSIIYSYRDRIKRVSIDSDFIGIFLDNNRRLIEKSTNYIDIYAYGEVDGSPALGYITGVVKHFNRLCTMPDMTEAEFDLYFEKYVVLFKSVEGQKVLADTNQILTEGVKRGSKVLVDFDDAHNYVRRGLSEIEGLIDKNQGTGFTSMREVLLTEKTEASKPIKVADFGKLEALNKVYGGIYTSNFYQVLAPSKGGKSKFCARVCHTAIVNYGTNVTVWAHEGGFEGWTAQMRAIHFDYTYNEGVVITEKKFGIDQDAILHDKYPSQDLKELEMASKIDLASNMEYGNVDFIDRPFYVETFIDEIDSSVKSNNSKIVIIDYLQLIGSENDRKSDRECIAKAYKVLLEYCKKNNVAVLTPAQYKQDAIDALANKNDTAGSEMRTAGGGSAEVFRTPDIIFALWASTADLQNNKMKILSIPCRFNKPFPEVDCYVDLGVCQFVSLDG